MKFLNFFKKDKGQARMAIIDVGDSDFKQQVIQRSYKTPVVVDYWAAWCGPCRQLGPVLERIAEEPDSDFILAKLDTESNQRTAAQFNIYSIPAVKAFRNGRIVEEFTGAIPEPLVRQFIDKVSNAAPPPPRLKGSSDPAKRLKQAEQHLRKGRGFEAFVLLDNFPDSKQSEKAEGLLPLARFLFDMDDGDGLTGLEALDDEYLAAAGSLRKGKTRQALDHLFTALEVGEPMDQPHTKKVIESLFILLGNNDISQEYRQKISAIEA
jgi:putative thioredoxin